MSEPKKPSRLPDMQPLWEWLKGRTCSVCGLPLDNGRGLFVWPGQYVRHFACVKFEVRVTEQ